MKEVEYFGLTDKGLKRASNQDCFAAKEIGPYLLGVVCDGMGGVGGGNVASEMACEYFTERFSDSIHSVDDYTLLSDAVLDRFFSNSVSKANFEVHREATRKPELNGMGTTLVSCLVWEGRVLIGNVGDSRLYHINSKNAVQITKDHSYVQMLVDAGEITLSQAADHPNKNIITRAVGVDKDVECDLYHREFKSGYLLLCSDGFSNYLNEKKLVSTVNSNASLSDKCRDLIRYANKCGGADNITVLLIKL